MAIPSSYSSLRDSWGSEAYPRRPGNAGPARGGSLGSASYTTGNPLAWFSTVAIGTFASAGTVTYNAHLPSLVVVTPD